MADGKKLVAKKKVGLISENLSLQIDPVKLDRTNYLAWTRSCLLFIQAKSLQGYFTGDKQKPEVTNPNYNQVEFENFLVM